MLQLHVRSRTPGSLAPEPASARGSLKETIAASLFGMGNYQDSGKFIALDFELKAPIPRNPALPQVGRFAIFLRSRERCARLAGRKSCNRLSDWPEINERGGREVMAIAQSGVFRFRVVAGDAINVNQSETDRGHRTGSAEIPDDVG